MERISQRLAGDYTLTVQAFDASGAPAEIQGPVSARLFSPSTEEIIDASVVVGLSAVGSITISVPASLAPALGTYRIVATGTLNSQQHIWETYFELVARLDTSPTEMLDDVRRELRVTSSAFDAEIENLIAAAKMDMILSGVSESAVNAPYPQALVRHAVILYCKARFGLDNPDSEKYMASFRSIEADLALSAEYRSAAAQ